VLSCVGLHGHAASLARVRCTHRHRPTPNATNHTPHSGNHSQLFESINLNGEKMGTLNTRTVETSIRSVTQGEVWVGDVEAVLKSMLSAEAQADEEPDRESDESRAVRESNIVRIRSESAPADGPPIGLALYAFEIQHHMRDIPGLDLAWLLAAAATSCAEPVGGWTGFEDEPQRGRLAWSETLQKVFQVPQIKVPLMLFVPDPSVRERAALMRCRDLRFRTGAQVDVFDYTRDPRQVPRPNKQAWMQPFVDYSREVRAMPVAAAVVATPCPPFHTDHTTCCPCRREFALGF